MKNISFVYLDSDKVVETTRKLVLRIEERFPNSGLLKIASELVTLGEDIEETCVRLQKPILWIRFVSILTILALIGVIYFLLQYVFKNLHNQATIFEMIQGLDAAVNEIILFVLAVYFIINGEKMWKRNIVLKKLHLLRSLIHVVDMHQLTKDPTVLRGNHQATKSSPFRTMSNFELMRYLDYCSEILSISGKYAALFAQDTQDGIILQAVNDIENSAQNLSQKIWQKIMVIGI